MVAGRPGPGRPHHRTLQAALGSAYVNDFNRFGRTYQVNVQADSRFRQRRSDISRLEVRNVGDVPIWFTDDPEIRNDVGVFSVNLDPVDPAASPVKCRHRLGLEPGQTCIIEVEARDVVASASLRVRASARSGGVDGDREIVLVSEPRDR